MKIIYIHQYFKTPDDGGAIRSYYLGRELVANGHEVEMITSWNKKHYEFLTIDGIKVHYLPVKYDNSMGPVKRIFAFFKFIFLAFRSAAKIKDINFCYASSTPITIGLIAILLKKIKKIPYYFEVRDLWPLAPVELGFIKNKAIINALYYFEKIIYKNAKKIIALSPSMKEYIEGKIDKEVLLLPNMADCDFFNPIFPAYPFTEENPFKIIYFGTIGTANHLEYLVEISHSFSKRHIKNVKFLIIGEGKSRENINKLISVYSLKNIQVLPPINKYLLKEIINTAHAAYISFAHYKVLETTSPNKFFDSLASGKLIISNVDGWIRDLVEKNNCGFYAPPNQLENFYSLLQPYLENEKLLKLSMQNSRALAEREFERKIICKKFSELF